MMIFDDKDMMFMFFIADMVVMWGAFLLRRRCFEKKFEW